MSELCWTEADTALALEIWSEYQRQHDVSGLRGQTAGIEPHSGRVWFGESARAVKEHMLGEGIDRPFFSVRVGYDYYLRKGRRR